MTLFDHTHCNRLFELAGSFEDITDVFICAGDEVNGGKDACEGGEKKRERERERERETERERERIKKKRKREIKR